MLGARRQTPGTPFTITYRETATFPLNGGPITASTADSTDMLRSRHDSQRQCLKGTSLDQSGGGALSQGSSSAGEPTGTEAADEQSRRGDDRMSMLLLVADPNRAAVTHLIKETSEGGS